MHGASAEWRRAELSLPGRRRRTTQKPQLGHLFQR